MPLITCPGCGKQISDAAPACIHCGMPNSAGPVASAPPVAAKSGMEAWMIVLIVIAVGFGFVFVLGIVAAIAIPQFAAASRVAREAEAVVVLKQAAALEEGYRRESGAYTADLSRLEGLPSTPLRFYSLSVSEASETSLCIDATPKVSDSPRIASQSIDQTGRLYRSAGCATAATTLDEHPDAVPEPPADAADEPASSPDAPAVTKPPKG